MTSTLTQADVTRLLADPSPETRAVMAVKIAREFERYLRRRGPGSAGPPV